VNEGRGPRRRRRIENPRPATRRRTAAYVAAAAAAIAVTALVWIGVSASHWLAPAGSSVIVPNFVGLAYASAVDAAYTAKVKLRIVARKPDYHAAKNQIVGQLPAAGEHVREGRVVDVVVSDGEPTAKVPNVANLSVRDATVALENARLDVGKVDYQNDPNVAEGTVLAQKPDALSAVPAGTKVDLTVAKGRPIQYAPNFVGMSAASASAAAKDAHVVLSALVLLPLAPSAPPKGIVTAQEPPAGQRLKPHQTIALQVSGGAPPTPVPSPALEASSSPQTSPQPAPQPSETSLLPAPTTARGLRVSVALPQSPTPVRIRVVLLDAAGTRTLYDQQTLGGFTLSFDLSVTGAGTLQTFVGDSLVNSTPL
jgi:beta-lactam-binding protein with PASTA domain